VANRIGKKTLAGSGAPNCALYIKILTGIKVIDEVLITKNRICGLLAVSGLG
jgi:hypothetical protein